MQAKAQLRDNQPKSQNGKEKSLVVDGLVDGEGDNTVHVSLCCLPVVFQELHCAHFLGLKIDRVIRTKG